MMQDPSPHVGLLRRAGNLNSNDLKAFADVDDRDPPPSSISRHHGLGNSLKRKLQNFKDRSTLLGRSHTTASTLGHRPHSKSLSDITTTHTAPIHAHSTSERTKQSAINPPPNLTEAVSVHDMLNAPESMSTSPAVGDIRVPLLLQQGTPMTKVSLKRHKKFVFRLDADLGQIVWESKQHKIS